MKAESGSRETREKNDEVTVVRPEQGTMQSRAQAMAALLSNPARCEQMGQAGKRRLAAFQASHVVQRLEELYVELAQAA